MFVRKDYRALEEGSHWIYENRHYSGTDPSHSRIMQWVTISLEPGDISIINVHGLWNGKGKIDSPHRILQSNIIKDFAKNLHTPTILCGDFNNKQGGPHCASK
jgi:endonuclease/exonuclease/phosphatase family metal-dependent hydrolase